MSKRNLLLYSIIIPSYNESNRLRKLLDELENLLFEEEKTQLFEMEIIFVDDGSSDDTNVILSDYPFKYLYQNNSGKGSAVKFGVQNAKGDFILVLDADGEYLISDIPNLIRFSLSNPLAVVYGSRYLKQNFIKLRLLPILGQSIVNLYFNYLLSLLILIRFRVLITDSVTGFKLYHREMYNKIDPKTLGFETDHELSKQILKWKIPIREYPVSYLPRSKQEGKKISWFDGLKALKIWLT